MNLYLFLIVYFVVKLLIADEYNNAYYAEIIYGAMLICSGYFICFLKYDNKKDDE